MAYLFLRNFCDGCPGILFCGVGLNSRAGLSPWGEKSMEKIAV